MNMLAYEISVVSKSASEAQANIRDATIVLDTSAHGRSDAPNAAELLLTAVATCMSKGVRRAAEANHFDVGRIEIHVHGVRQDSPSKMLSIEYEIVVETEVSDPQLDLLHRNVLKYGTVTNTVTPGVALEGSLRRMSADD